MRGRADDSVDLTKIFSDDSFRRALEDWAWPPVAGKRPFLASLFGDVLLEAADGIWMLDVLEFLPGECRTVRPVRGRSGGRSGRPMAVPATEWPVPTASP
jgi:hypothetical protein